MAEMQTIVAVKRDGSGKGPARAARREGRVPGVIYGGPDKPQMIAIDYAALTKWDDYTKARDEMLEATDTPEAPWTVVLANDQKRARLNIVRHLLSSLDYAGKDTKVVKQPDPLILGTGPELLGKG